MIDRSPVPDTKDRIKAIRYSLRCFAFSLAGLIPLLAVPMALLAFVNYRKARAASRGAWNPAQNYLFWSGVISSLSLLIFFIIVLYGVCAALKLWPWQADTPQYNFND